MTQTAGRIAKRNVASANENANAKGNANESENAKGNENESANANAKEASVREERRRDPENENEITAMTEEEIADECLKYTTLHIQKSAI